MASVAAATAFGVGSVGVLTTACCIQCSATRPDADSAEEAQDLLTPRLPLELREASSRLKSVLATLDPAAAIERGMSDSGGPSSEDEVGDKQLRTALARVGALEAELEQTQVSFPYPPTPFSSAVVLILGAV